MIHSTRRRSALAQTDSPRKDGRKSRTSSTDGGRKRDMWSAMLDSVASGKRLPEKNVFVLGGTPDSQKEFLKELSQDRTSGRKPHDRLSKKTPPIANEFALGYTYQDVLDTDHEDILARLSLYLLSDPSPSFMRLLKPLLTSQTLSTTLIVILLDWSQPWKWLRQLRDWIRLLRSLLASLDDECQAVMEEVMKDWRDRGRTTGRASGGSGIIAVDGDVSIPLGPGEWDEALGLPLCVVCQNADQTETLEKEQGWREEEFDFILQTIRTVLLKHGSSLIYTSRSHPNSLQTLIHSSLDIHSLLKRQALKHNVVDRDKVLIPPNWDSWGKIRILREGFDVEAVHKGWTIDLHQHQDDNNHDDDDDDGPADKEQHQQQQRQEDMETRTNGSSVKPTKTTATATAISVYEEAIRDPHADPSSSSSSPSPLSSSSSPAHPDGGGSSSKGQRPRRRRRLFEVETLDTQEFLAGQLEVMERIRAEEEHAQAQLQQQEQHQQQYRKDSSGTGVTHDVVGLSSSSSSSTARITDQIGPVQFNMGGIQIDADDMLKRIRLRHEVSSPSTAAAAAAATTAAAVSSTSGTTPAFSSSTIPISFTDHQYKQHPAPHPPSSLPPLHPAPPTTQIPPPPPSSSSTSSPSPTTTSSFPSSSLNHPAPPAPAPTPPTTATAATAATLTQPPPPPPSSSSNTTTTSPTTTLEPKSQNEALASFFAGLMKRGSAAGAGKEREREREREKDGR